MSGIRFQVAFDDVIADTEVPEDCTIADLAIFIGDDCLTLHQTEGRRVRLGPKTYSNTVRGPIAGLVDWLIDNWSSILWETQTPFKRNGTHRMYKLTPPLPGIKEVEKEWEGYIDSSDVHEDDYFDHDTVVSYDRQLEELADWQHRHLLGHATSDLAIPSIVIAPDDRKVFLSIDRASSSCDVKFCGLDGKPRVLTQHVLPKSEFRSSAQAFIESVIKRIQDSGKFDRWADWVSKRWLAAQENERDPSNQLEIMIGEIGAKRVEHIRQSEPILAAGLRQLLLDCRKVEHGSDLDPLEDVLRQFFVHAEAKSSTGKRWAWESMSNAKIPLDEPDFMQGYALAKEARHYVNLGTEPITDVAETLKQFDVKLEKARSTPLYRAAACAIKGRKAHIIPSSSDTRMRKMPGHNFAVASALGRLLWDAWNPDNNIICVAQGDYSLFSESRRANAFAAEWLLPGRVARRLSPESPALRETAERYGISEAAASWHARNAKDHSL
jgi:hypothetical protein